MVIIVCLVALSLALVVAGLVFFITRLKAGDFEHGERLSLLPLANDEVVRTADGAEPAANEEGEVVNGNS